MSSTVEKLLQLVPVDDEEFPSLHSVAQQSQISLHCQIPPQRGGSSGPVGTTDSGSQATSNTSNLAWQNQPRNLRLQGPTHIPPNKQNQGVGRRGNAVSNNTAQKNQQKQNLPNQQQSKGQVQSNFGKGSAPSNQKSGSVAMSNQQQQQLQAQMQGQGGFYQMGGSNVTSMPAMGSLDPSTSPSLLYYHRQAALHQQQQQQQQQQRQLQQSRIIQPSQFQPRPPHNYQSHSHSQYQVRQQARGGQLPQSQHQQQTQPQQQQWHSAVGTGNSGATSLYGYPEMRENDPYFANWMNPAPAQSSYTDQFHVQGQQNWPNIGEASLPYQEREVKTQNSLSYGGGTYPRPGMNSLLGDPPDHAKLEWPLYAPGRGINERTSVDPVSALLHPPGTADRSPMSSKFGSQGLVHVHSEPSFPKQADSHQRREGEKAEPHGSRKDGAPASGGKSGNTGTGNRKKMSDTNRPKKLIILRGLPGSGKTTLAR